MKRLDYNVFIDCEGSSVVQEQVAHNHLVAGSNPAPHTKFLRPTLSPLFSGDFFCLLF